MATLETYGIPSKSHFVNPVLLGSLPIHEDADVNQMMAEEDKYFTTHGYEDICFRIVNN